MISWTVFGLFFGQLFVDVLDLTVGLILQKTIVNLCSHVLKVPEEKLHYRKTDVDTFPLLEKFEQRMPRHFSKKSKKPGSIAREIEGGHLSKVPSWLTRAERVFVL